MGHPQAQLGQQAIKPAQGCQPPFAQDKTYIQPFAQSFPAQPTHSPYLHNPSLDNLPTASPAHPCLHSLPTVPTCPAWGAVRSLIQQVGAKCSLEPGGSRGIGLAPRHAAATTAAAAAAA